MEENRQCLTVKLNADTAAFDNSVKDAMKGVDELNESLKDTVKLTGAAGVHTGRAAYKNVMREFIAKVAGNDGATRVELKAMAAVASVVADYGD